MKSKLPATEPLETRKLANGVTVELYDRSRPLAGDRWLVRLCCRAAYEITPELLKAKPVEEPELQGAILAEIGETLDFTIHKDRNFVAEEEKEQIGRQLVQQLKENMIHYLETPGFPAKLFRKCYAEARQKCLIARRQIPEDEPDDDGPADFSACFQGPDCS